MTSRCTFWYRVGSQPFQQTQVVLEWSQQQGPLGDYIRIEAPYFGRHLRRKARQRGWAFSLPSVVHMPFVTAMPKASVEKRVRMAFLREIRIQTTGGEALKTAEIHILRP